MKPKTSQGFLLCLALLIASLAICVSSEASLIRQPSWNPNARPAPRKPTVKPTPPRCEPAQARYDMQCYSKLGNQTLGCESGLGGEGSLDTVCRLTTSVTLGASSVIVGAGALEIAPRVAISCAVPGCEILVLLSGSLVLASQASISGGSLTIQAGRVAIQDMAWVNSTALGGAPPIGSSGTPSGFGGAGGGYGGRGAACEGDEEREQGEAWGGEVYEWETLAAPWSYGSRGGTTERRRGELGGGGGGRIAITTGEFLLNGTIEANGGSVGVSGGGGSGGSIVIKARKIEGREGMISASGGTGRGGGGGGRVSVDCERLEGVEVFYHGGDSLGCPQNAGAAGTRFDVKAQSLTISNNKMKSKTDTVLLAFPLRPLWGSVVVKEAARIVPMEWSRIQVAGEVMLMSESLLNFGQGQFSSSDLELMAVDFIMENSTLLVFGALRLTANMLSMTNSLIDIIASPDELMVSTSTVEASNLAYIKGGSAIRSNANLGVHGQGLLQLEGSGDTIMAQRVFVSLFFNVIVGPGAMLRAPLEPDSPIQDQIMSMYCEKSFCPEEVLRPSEDCTLNISSPFTLQICRVEDVDIYGEVSGSVVHIQRARNVSISREGVLSASGLGCLEGLGVGNVTKKGAGGGGGHGGKGGSGVLGEVISNGGSTYGKNELPCEFGSGGGNPGIGNSNAGGGLIVLGSIDHPVTVLDVYGVLAADGESSIRADLDSKVGGPGGGSGGSLLLFLQTMTLGNGSLLSTAGGQGGAVGGGGGAGGRVHFHWSDILTGEDYVPIAIAEGLIDTSGGAGSKDGLRGDDGDVSGKQCPRGLYGLYCVECPVGTYKNDTGSSSELCVACPPLPQRAKHTYVRGGVLEPTCPYQCVSEKYRMPHCHTMLEDLIYTLGGPYLFTLFLSSVMVVLALMLSVARMKLVGNDDYSRTTATPRGLHVEQSFPFLESLNEVLETTRVEESQCHIHRMYFMGSNSFNEPWHLPHSPPDQIEDFVYEGAYNRFVEELNGLAAYQWWEGSVHSILIVLAYPFSWTWQQWRRREKLRRLQEFVHSEYDHACLRSCRSRALYEGLKVAAGPDLILAYIDVFLGGDEKRPELPPSLHERLPMSIIFGGNGSYLSPYNFHSDNLLTNLLSQAVPATMWYRLVAGLNAQLRTVRKGSLRITLLPVVSWLETHANPWLFEQGLRIELAWCQATASGYYQLGLLLNEADDIPQYFQPASMLSTPRSPGSVSTGSFGSVEEGVLRRPQSWHLSPSYSSKGSRRRIGGATLDMVSVKTLEDKHFPLFPLSFLLRNSRPVGQQASVGLVISLLILVDLSLTLLTLLQFYSVGIVAVLLIVLSLPLSSILPCAAGLNALFSHGSKRSAGLARVYALWNVTSLVNVLVALVIGFLHYNMKLGLHTSSGHLANIKSEEDTWWLLPALLFLVKCVQARTINYHVANLEIQDRSLYASDPLKFWEP